jgi:PPOX class probable F420-dependent enzyme
MEESATVTLSDAEAAVILATNLGVLATIRDDGTPHLTPLWVDWDGTHVLINTAVGRIKERHIRKGRPVTILVIDKQDTIRYVQVTGHAELTTDGADAHIDKMANKYLGLTTYPEVFRAPGEVRVIAKITPERVASWNVEPDSEWPDPPSSSS